VSKTFEIQVEDDHLQRISQVRKPVHAVAELIWNALDADANQVDVMLHNDVLGGLASIEVIDDGHGIPHAQAEDMFRPLGGSWKKNDRRSPKGRILHGKEGRGRLRALALGRVVEWRVRYAAADGKVHRYTIVMIKDQLKRVQLSDETTIPGELLPGVTVLVKEFDREFRSLRSPAVTEELAQIFALYLRQYSSIRITYCGDVIDPRAVEDFVASRTLPNIVTPEGESFPASLDIVEWKMPTERRMYFCDANGFPLDDTPPGIQAPGFNFTAYLKSDYFAKLLAENRLGIADLDSSTSKILTAAKEAMRDHFRERASEKAAGLVADWRREKVYPYEGPPATEIEEAERQVFNVVALNVNHFSPKFQEADEKTKRLQLRLLRAAVENAPADLSRILTEVLDLPTEKRQELTELLDRTTLAHIIGASKIIADRLEFLNGLETLVFDDEYKHTVRERTQLHRIVAENAWMFGEQYHLSVDDQSLTEVLKKHVQLQDRELEIEESVKRPDGSRGIVDLMFSRNIQLPGSEEREHLIVELKRPDVKINAAALTQIKSYAFSVVGDERFRDVNTKWVFWAVSSDLDEFARREVSQRDRPRGAAYQSDDPSITIWVRTWSQIINDCRSRLRFFAEKLNYTPDRDSSLAHLKTTYQKYLADLFAPTIEPPPAEVAPTESVAQSGGTLTGKKEDSAKE
jgi:hypothetical protein